jgi:hypothetical protein
MKQLKSICQIYVHEVDVVNARLCPENVWNPDLLHGLIFLIIRAGQRLNQLFHFKLDQRCG